MNYIFLAIITIISYPTLLISMNKHRISYTRELNHAINTQNNMQLLTLLSNEKILKNYPPAIILKNTCDGDIADDSPFFNRETWDNFQYYNLNKEAFFNSAMYLIKTRSEVTPKLSTAARLSYTYNHLVSLKKDTTNPK